MRSRRGRRKKVRVARVATRRAFRKLKRLPKRIIVKKYVNTIGQIAYKKGSARPSHGRRRIGRRVRRFKRRY